MKPTSYQLLKDVYDAVNRLEDKIDKRVGLIEERLDKVESKTDNLLGKIGIGVIIISSIISTAVIAIYGWIKARFT